MRKISFFCKCRGWNVFSVLYGLGVAKVHFLAKYAVNISSHGAMRRNEARFTPLDVGVRHPQPHLLRLLVVLRNALVLCEKFISHWNFFYKNTWPEFQPSLPRGLLGLKPRSVLLPGCRPWTSRRHGAYGTEPCGRRAMRRRGGTSSTGSPTGEQYNSLFVPYATKKRRRKPGKAFPPLPLKRRSIHGLQPNVGEGHPT